METGAKNARQGRTSFLLQHQKTVFCRRGPSDDRRQEKHKEALAEKADQAMTPHSVSRVNHCTTPAQARELGRLQALLGAEQEKSKGLQEKIERYITAYDEGARKLLALEISDASLRSLQGEQAKARLLFGFPPGVVV